MNLPTDRRLAFMATDFESGDLDLQDVETINPDVIVTNLGNSRECNAESDFQHYLPPGLVSILLHASFEAYASIEA
jgi:hypothetical protein